MRADFVPRESVTLKSAVVRHVEYERQHDFAIALYFNGRSLFLILKRTARKSPDTEPVGTFVGKKRARLHRFRVE